jgi:hypothetical protein
VLARASELAQRIESGEPLADVVPADMPPSGLVVLQGRSPLIRDDEAHRVHALHEALGSRMPDSDAVFRDTLAVPWGVLALLGQDTQAWLLVDPERQRMFLQAILDDSDRIDELDGRFTLGQTTGSALWELPTNLQFVLARQGVPAADLIGPAPDGGWPELARRALNRS